MSERGTKSRKSSASRAPAPKASVAKAPVLKQPAKTAAKTERAKRVSGSSARKPGGAGAAVALDAPSLMARVIRLESERDRLQAALEKAESRVRELEEGREQVVNRIDWVIDSLRSLIEE